MQPEIRHLQSYWDVQLQAVYWIDLVFNGTEWWPETTLPMPHHHATRLELTNMADFPALAAHQASRVRFTLEVTTRDIQQVPGRHQWRVTYHARIVGVCAPALR